MPCKGFIHPLTLEHVPFDHFDTDTSNDGRPAVPPWAARFIAAKIEGDIRHSTLDLTATRCLGCPRQVFIEVLLDWYTSPNDSFLMHRGSAMHSVAESHWNPDTHISEGSDRGAMTVAGTMFDVPISALMDCVAHENRRVTEIIDLKFPSDFSVKFRRGVAKDDHAFQLNIGRHLLAQQSWATDAGYDPDSVLLTIWDHACGKGTGPIPQSASHMTEEQMLAHKPGGGDYCVQQIIDSYMEAKTVYAMAPHAERLKESSCRELIGSMPLIGRTMYNNKKCPQYCSVNDICDDIEMSAQGTGE